MNRIADYAVIGDCHSLALVGRDGAVDWACFPRFDSPSVFARVLDDRCGGCFTVRPAGPVTGTTRRYLPGTMVLESRYEVPGGALEVTDTMPVSRLDPDDPTAVGSHHSILRRIVGRGAVTAEVLLAPRFEYARVVPRFTITSLTTAEIVGGTSALWVRTTRALEDRGDALGGTWPLADGEEAWIEVAWSSAHDDPPPEARRTDAGSLRELLDSTVAYWRAWLARGWYEGEWERHLHRSAMILKALTYAPTGAVVAAGTTSLPEWIGGSRNWDYRYTWIRDATLALTALFVLGYEGEARAFKVWLERTGAGRPEDLQIMYGVGGERLLPEIELRHLAGHRGSKPVLIGNAAVEQVQLDSYGQILEAASLYARVGGELTESNGRFLAGLADVVAREWRRPDQGIWEMRDRPRHFTHSKLNCWVALDRAALLAHRGALAGDVATWSRERNLLHEYLLHECAAKGWFTQAGDSEVADASTLLVPALGLLPTEDPRVQATIAVVERDLTTDGLVHRYLSPDGLEGGEGAFLLCSFWLLDCLTHSGRIEEAGALLERLLALANDVGMFSEEVDPATGEQLGNIPQAFTHMALVQSVAHLVAARAGRLAREDRPRPYAQRALDRLLAARGALLPPDDA